MLKYLILLLVPSFTFAYPELVSKNCLSCHSEASGFGILTAEGKASVQNWSDKKSESYYEVKTPEWLMLGLKADLNQTFTKSPYEKTGSFKATRFEGQIGLVHNVSKYLNVQAQGSLNRVEPKTKSDSITDFIYSPYHFVELNYHDPTDSVISLKHGYYRNEWQNDLSLFSDSFKQSELIYLMNRHQVSLGHRTRSKTYNASVEDDTSFITYKYFTENQIDLILGHERKTDDQLSSLGLVYVKNENLTFKTLLAQTINSGVKGLKARFMPFYQTSPFLKFYAVTEYGNTNIETAKPRTIIYGLGADYLWLSQGLLSVIYTKTDDSVVINNPVEKLELNFHLYM
ncbi:hypothetical protein CIK05_08445 [Bdellovibrio sp. qaytius]|nr:hypothetical protein CIK05_08445 [Bdellovibrio sp. qaytius]